MHTIIIIGHNIHSVQHILPQPYLIQHIVITDILRIMHEQRYVIINTIIMLEYNMHEAFILAQVIKMWLFHT